VRQRLSASRWPGCDAGGRAAPTRWSPPGRFSVELKGIYPAGTVATAIRNFAYGALLLPPGNRFVAPLALGVGLIAWVLRPRRALRVAPLTRDVAPAADRREGGRARDDQENRPATTPPRLRVPRRDEESVSFSICATPSAPRRSLGRGSTAASLIDLTFRHRERPREDDGLGIVGRSRPSVLVQASSMATSCSLTPTSHRR